MSTTSSEETSLSTSNSQSGNGSSHSPSPNGSSPSPSLGNSLSDGNPKDSSPSPDCHDPYDNCINNNINNKDNNNKNNKEIHTTIHETLTPLGFRTTTKFTDDIKALTPPGAEMWKSATGSISQDQIKLIVGISVGVGLLLIILFIICICCCCCCRKKKKKQKEDKNQKHMPYYGEYPMGPPPPEHYYMSSGQFPPGPPPQQKWQQSPGHPPPPPMGMNYSGGSGWQSGPPMSSGDMASGNYSNLQPPPPPPPTISLGFNKSTFTYEELMSATGGFAQSNLLGQGGFGYVHKGVLPNGKEVAVKSLKSGSGQGEREFMAEVEIISRVHHRHLVSLVGYSVTNQQRLLVYEFLPNDTLELHLHGRGLPIMDFPTRLKIALGSAKGLAYLHEDCHPKIIHRDIKSSNILLDLNFDAKVADFGLAKLSTDNHTHVSTRVMGTFGYLAPEYASSGKLTEKSDVFSFGVMLLELIAGKRPVDPTNVMEDSLVDWARPLLTRALDEGNLNELVDLRLEGNFNSNEMQRMIACAAASIRHSAKKRPKMSQIVHTLEGDASLDHLNEGVRPGQSTIFGAGGGGSGGEYDIGAYNADMARFRQVALSSQEFDSSEHGTSSTTSDSRDMAPTTLRKYNL
ncbi:Proline-rich receptor-like protein kinase PERK5 [Linum perenne]